MKQYVFHNRLNFLLSHPPDYALKIQNALNINIQDLNLHLISQQQISLKDATNICNYFGCSLDSLMNVEKSYTYFKHFAFGYNIFSVRNFWDHLDGEIRMSGDIQKVNSVYLAADLPIFYLFKFPELAAFKLFYWATFSYDQPGFIKKNFDLDLIDLELVKTGNRIWSQYLKMNAIEIWGNSVIDNLLKQIEKVIVEKKFNYKADLKLVLDQTCQLLSEVEMQASVARIQRPHANLGIENYNLFLINTSEINNTILLNSKNQAKTFYVYFTLDHLLTTDRQFCNQTALWLKKLTLQARPLSGNDNKIARENFFALEMTKIHTFIAKHKL